MTTRRATADGVLAVPGPGGRADVIVVGAGWSGLSAAAALESAGLHVVILEADGRVGGKVESRRDSLGRLVDTGGQFVCDDMTEILPVLAALGATLIDVYVPGEIVTLPRTPGNAEATNFADDWLSHRPAPGGLQAGSTVGDLIDSAALNDAQAGAIGSAVDGTMCLDHRRVPAAQLDHTAQSSPLTVPELQYIVAETMGVMVQRFAAGLRSAIHLGHRVERIELAGERLTVSTGKARWSARQIVVALPPTAIVQLEFVPALPVAVIRALDSFAPGAVIKFLVGYSEQFWLSRNLSGTSRWIEPSGLYACDASLPGAAMIVVFVGGPTALAWRALGETDRRTAVIAHLVEAFGSAAGSPVSFVERCWFGDDLGRGGYWNVGIDDDVVRSIGVLRRGVGAISFAGTELAERFPGYIDGAIASGRAAAEQVIERLG